MALLALGINHKSANIALRERVAFAPEQMTEALKDALKDAGLSELVILSTCNRTELFVSNDNGKVDAFTVLQWLSEYNPSRQI
jgi:glutamyl-tRNA reductase